MDVPVEPFLTSKRASYVVNDESPQRPAVTAVNMDADGPDAAGTGVQARLDQFRDFVSRTCCSCVAKMPAIMLVIAICLVVALLLALIPAVFVLTNAVSSESQAQVSSGFDIPGMRNGFKKPDHDDDDLEDTEDLPGTVYGIPMTALLPPNVSMCHGWGFACTNDPSTVISTHRRCDGVVDCPDGSDEINCNECQSAASCSFGESSEFLICLSPSQLCDGVGHCPDRFDEEAFCTPECKENELQCKGKNGANLCLPENTRCDGVEDCRDGSDEKDCTACFRGAKMCEPTSECIAARNVCDSVAQCPDGSDEAGCDCRSCSGSSQAVCDDGTCIEEWRVCDGFSDCSNGLDEVDCPGRCDLEEDSQPQETVICSNGRKYLQSEACSGEVAECDHACEECAPEAFTCSSDNKCIPRRKVCDGHNDCLNGEDEEDCGCDEQEGVFKCQGKCLPKERRCDGILDCADESDEEDCPSCPENSFRCEADQTCFPASARCDGIVNCHDGADEAGCSCHECIGLHSLTYMCGDGSRCLLRDEACAPYSMCPNATMADKTYCAALSLRAF